MDLHFDCTQCGRCCHNLKLPLSVEEAIGWAGAGHPVQLLAEASPAFEEPAEDAPERYKYDRSFPASSGTVPIRVSVILVAAFEGACPHLQPDMLCGNYDARPRVCRIYPAEMSPHVELIPDRKACPPEAWSEDRPLYSRGRDIVDDELASLVAAHRQATLEDVAERAVACRELGIASAAFVNEGYAVHSPLPARMVAALSNPRQCAASTNAPEDWAIVTNRHTTLAMLDSVDARPRMAESGNGYIGFFDDLSG